jgi:SAM-dependent methyltransferase
MDSPPDYDEIPYHITPFSEIHPGNLAVIGRLFGLGTPEAQHCRVLDLGCASGGNLIPMAWYLPGSEFVGVELSARQSKAGDALIRRLGLTMLAAAEMGLASLATVRPTMEIDPFTARLVSYLDGTRDRSAIIERLAGDILDRRDLDISDAAPADRTRLTSQVAANCGRLLQTFARHGILQALEVIA